jgi:hypothetical protein
METATVAESVLQDKQFKSSLIKALVVYMTNNDDYVEQIRIEATKTVRDGLENEANIVLEKAKELVRTKANNIFKHNIENKIDFQLDKIVEQFTDDYVRELVVKHFRRVLKDKINNTEVSFRLGSLFDD